MDKLLWYLFAGTRGGETRARIIVEIRKTPQNANQLSSALKMDYKTIQHHITILLKNQLITQQGNYGALYFLSDYLEENYAEFEDIWKRFGNNSGKTT